MDFPMQDAANQKIVALEKALAEEKAYSASLLKQMKENTDHINLVLGSSRTGIWIWDIETNISHWDTFMHHLFGIPDRTFDGIDKTFYNFVHPDDRQRIKTEIKNAKKTLAPFDTEYRITWHDGSMHDIGVRGQIVMDQNKKPTKIIGVCMDITEKKYVARAMARYAETLEKQNLKLERSNEELEQFAYIASHDLQEPLRKIKGYSERLKNYIDKNFVTEYKKDIEKIYDASVRMSHLIHSLLEYAQVLSYEHDDMEVDLDKTVRTVLSDVELQIKEIKATVTVAPLPVIYGDPLQLQQLFQNLVSNAIKYYRESTKPEIKLYTEKSTARSEKHFRIIIEDNGIGFDNRYAKQIFSVFKRLHGRSHYSGTGIGLAVCEKIVTRLNGTITAEGTPKQGAKFIISLPISRLAKTKERSCQIETVH